MSFIDQDGVEAGVRARAHLDRAVQGTNVWVEISTCDSNTSNNTGPQKLTCILPQPYTINSKEWYWFDVEIERTDPRVNVEFLGILVLYDVDQVSCRRQPNA